MKKRKQTFDTSTKTGRNSKSQARNRGADRMVEHLQNYQKSTDHKVLLNLIPTWPGGKPRVWHSHPAEEITPVFKTSTGKIKPFKSQTVKQDCIKEDNESSWGATNVEQATPGTEALKCDLDIKCGHCGTGPTMADMHPNTPWIRCGEKNCKSANFAFHAICHGIRLPRDVNMFNCLYVRCTMHLKRSAEAQKSDDSDLSDYQKSKKQSSRTEKVQVINSDVEDQGDQKGKSDEASSNLPTGRQKLCKKSATTQREGSKSNGGGYFLNEVTGEFYNTIEAQTDDDFEGLSPV